MVTSFKDLKIRTKLFSIGVISALILVLSILFNSYQFYKMSIDERRDKVRNLVEGTMGPIQEAYDRQKAGLMSEEDAKKIAASSIQKVIYNKDDYFWIVDTKGTLVMHPHRKEKVGSNVYEETDSQGVPRYKLMILGATGKGEPYVNYHHTRPGAKPGEVFKKISYSKVFEPWGWVVNTGIYIDDVVDAVLGDLTIQFGAMFVLLGLLFIATKVISSRISKPLEEAKQVIEAIVDEKFNVSLPEVSSKDEVGEILQATHKLYESSVNGLQIKASIESVDACLMIANTKGSITYVNPALKRLFSKYGSQISSHLSISENSRLEALTPFLDNKDIKANQAFHTNCKIGDCDFNLGYYPVFNKHDEHLGTVVVWTDLPQELKVQNEVKTMLKGAINGDLTYRIPLDGKEGFMEILCTDLNQFLGVTEKSLVQVEEVLSKLADGDLKVRMNGKYSGIFDSLQQSTNTTAARLEEVISQLVNTSESIHDIVEHVASQNEKLSARTENQASNLQETASSMEEISSTIHLSSDNAKQAREFAVNSEKSAVTGEQIASQSIHAINAIKSSSEKVFGVIEMINDISFQTNLLALNASVEAARAGEHGKGFAVVAEEVRSLAQRCAGAAKEIQELIKESNKHVLEGVKLTQETGDSFKEIVVSTKDLSRLVSEIALASVEQATGVQQINMAISKMDEVTQQNAGLVQEELRVVEQLRDEAQKMSEMVKMFH